MGETKNDNRIKRRLIAKFFGISRGHLSDILNGKRPIGRRTSKKIAERVGVPVSEHVRFMVMPPDQLEKELRKHLKTEGDDAV